MTSIAYHLQLARTPRSDRSLSFTPKPYPLKRRSHAFRDTGPMSLIKGNVPRLVRGPWQLVAVAGGPGPGLRVKRGPVSGRGDGLTDIYPFGLQNIRQN